MKLLQAGFARNLIGAGWSASKAERDAVFLLAVMQGMTTLSRATMPKAELRQIADATLAGLHP